MRVLPYTATDGTPMLFQSKHPHTPRPGPTVQCGWLCCSSHHHALRGYARRCPAPRQPSAVCVSGSHRVHSRCWRIHAGGDALFLKPSATRRCSQVSEAVECLRKNNLLFPSRSTSCTDAMSQRDDALGRSVPSSTEEQKPQLAALNGVVLRLLC